MQVYYIVIYECSIHAGLYIQEAQYLITWSCRALFLCGTKLEKRTTTLMEVAKWKIEQISPNKRDESITIKSGPISWDLVATFNQMSH